MRPRSRAVSRALSTTAGCVTAGLVIAACGSSETSRPAASEPTATEPTATEPTATEPAVTELAATDVVELAASPPDPAADCPTEGEEWEVAKLYIEHNATDADTGVHGLFGGMAWSVMCITDPTGATILLADPRAGLDGLSIADLFFESREPPNDDYPIDRIRAEFPAGDYTVAGVDFEGTPRIGTAVFTHDIPAEPSITAPALAEDPEAAGDAAVPTTGLVVTWDAVTETIDGTPAMITGYEVIITDEEASDPNGFARPVYDVHVPAEQLFLGVPAEFLRPATIYELEVLAIEQSGNQTISVGFFSTQ